MRYLTNQAPVNGGCMRTRRDRYQPSRSQVVNQSSLLVVADSRFDDIDPEVKPLVRFTIDRPCGRIE